MWPSHSSCHTGPLLGTHTHTLYAAERPSTCCVGCAHSDTLIATAASEVPSAVSAVAFQSIEHVEAVCRQADSLASTTPKSFRRHLYSLTHSGTSATLTRAMVSPSNSSRNDVCYSSTPPSEALVARVEAQLCMSVDADELVAENHSGATSASTASDTSSNAAATAAAQGIRYMVLDCRPQDEVCYIHRVLRRGRCNRCASAVIVCCYSLMPATFRQHSISTQSCWLTRSNFTHSWRASRL